MTISVSSTDDTKQRFLAAFKGKPQGAHISFPTVELLWKVLAPNRMALVRALSGAGVVSIREAARRVNRDVRAGHSDVTALINAGLLKRTEDGIEFPYEAVHVDFILKAAQAGMVREWPEFRRNGRAKAALPVGTIARARRSKRRQATGK